MVGTFGDYIKAVKYGVYDHTENGICSQCGECCSNLLPLTDDEINRIKRYVKRNGVKEQRHLIPLADAAFDLMCPFLDMGKTKDKCTIYPARGTICKVFVCNKANETGVKSDLYDKPRFPIDMRKTFFGEN